MHTKFCEPATIPMWSLCFLGHEFSRTPAPRAHVPTPAPPARGDDVPGGAPDIAVDGARTRKEGTPATYINHRSRGTLRRHCNDREAIERNMLSTARGACASSRVVYIADPRGGRPARGSTHAPPGLDSRKKVQQRGSTRRRAFLGQQSLAQLSMHSSEASKPFFNAPRARPLPTVVAAAPDARGGAGQVGPGLKASGFKV